MMGPAYRTDNGVESISKRGWPMKSTAYRFSVALEVTETEDANGLPVVDRGGTVESSPRFEMLFTMNSSTSPGLSRYFPGINAPFERAS
jgi:hypothetical protein